MKTERPLGNELSLHHRIRRMPYRWFALAMFMLGSACGGDNSTASPPSTTITDASSCGSDVDLGAVVAACPNDRPSETGCPASAPSFQAVVFPLISQKCTVCHAPGAVAAFRPYTSYELIYATRREMLTRVYSCVMPPACAAPLSADERRNFLQWFVCGAPNN